MRIAREALTFDDVLLQPDYSDVLPREVDMSTQLTAEIRLNIPLLSAAMDTVTESKLAIALAQEGGIGIIHKNMLPEEQARHVLQVKKYESGIVRDPITVPPDMTIREVIALTSAMNISGVPVVEGKQTIGIVTHRDLRFETKLDAPVATVMTPKERLVTVREGADDAEVLSLLHKHRIEKVLVVTEDFELRGMITAKDFQKASDYPRACKDDRGALRVGAAVGTGYDTDERIAALVKAGVDVVVVDTSHGFSKGVVERVRQILGKLAAAGMHGVGPEPVALLPVIESLEPRLDPGSMPGIMRSAESEDVAGRRVRVGSLVCAHVLDAALHGGMPGRYAALEQRVHRQGGLPGAVLGHVGTPGSVAELSVLQIAHAFVDCQVDARLKVLAALVAD